MQAHISAWIFLFPVCRNIAIQAVACQTLIAGAKPGMNTTARPYEIHRLDITRGQSDIKLGVRDGHAPAILSHPIARTKTFRHHQMVRAGLIPVPAGIVEPSAIYKPVVPHTFP